MIGEDIAREEAMSCGATPSVLVKTDNMANSDILKRKEGSKHKAPINWREYSTKNT
jgi:hypothetical protein